ncbi:MAG: AsmA-like C-terminal region-containing protein [Fulvivirga sp.]
MNLIKVLKKIFLYLFLAVFAVVSGSILASFLYRDQLIDHFIREANKSINTPIHVDEISVSSLRKFPQVSLSFKGVYIEESFDGSSYPLLQADKIDFTFNPLAVFKGNYTIEQVHMKDGKCHLKMNKAGEINYDIFKKVDTTQQHTVAFDLSKITLKNITFTYTNDLKNVHLEMITSSTEANLSAVGKSYDIQTDGDVQLKYLMINNSTWAKEKQLQVQSTLNYDDRDKHLVIHTSTVGINNSDFLVDGNYAFKNEQLIDLNVKGKNTDIQTLLSILPERTTEKFIKYKSKGGVYFDLNMRGEIGGKSGAPALEIKFGLTGSELYHPDSDVKITHADMAGHFKAREITDLGNATLTLKNISGELEDNHFTGNLYMKNFNTPFVRFDFEGRVDINSLFKFYKAESIESAEGVLNANLNFEGNLSDLKNKSKSRRLKTSGDINLDNLSIKLAEFPLAIENLRGNLLFNNNDLALSDVSGKLGKSDFLLNGFFKNIIAYLLFDNQPVGIESDLKSDFIDLDELLAANSGDKKSDSKYSFSISPRLVLDFNCEIEHLKFRRFNPRAIHGALKVKDQVVLSDGIQFNAMGGPISLTALVDASMNSLVKVNTSFNLKNINIDSAFYVFENFNQTFLEDRHLKGKIFADVNAEMIFNDELHLFSESLTSNITTSIRDGQLNNFEPMQKLTKYLNEDKLDHLRFSELKNTIHISKRTIYLPEMEVSSNISDIRISGTHTFDQKIDYKVVTPLRSRQKIDSDEAFGAIEEDNTGRAMLYLKIAGTTSDYRVMYDKASVKQKMISDLKKEVDELKSAFKNKGLEKTKTIEVNEDDYFDWE